MAIRTVNKIIGQYEVSKGLKKEDLRPLANDPITSSIQFSSPLNEQEIGLLEDVIFSQRPDIALRVYGHYLEDAI